MTLEQFKSEMRRHADSSGLSEADLRRAFEDLADEFTPISDGAE